MRTRIYIDGFNLYFRILKENRDLRWLNPRVLCEDILSKEEVIDQVNYYTARVSGKIDPRSPRNQNVYWSALKTIQGLKIHQGQFLTKKVYAPLATPPKFKPDSTISKPWPDVVRILKTEEKGSDVNLASHLILDGARDEYDLAIVITNDNDLVEPIRIVTQELNKTVGLLSPVGEPTHQLLEVASFMKNITLQDLKKAQFPQSLTSVDGKALLCPENWK